MVQFDEDTISSSEFNLQGIVIRHCARLYLI